MSTLYARGEPSTSALRPEQFMAPVDTEGWIPVTDRLPTPADTNASGDVIWLRNGVEKLGWVRSEAPAGATHWCTVDAFNRRKQRARMPQITEKQFDAMVKLMRGRPQTPTNIAARQVLVHGVKQVTARLQLGDSITRASVCNAVTSYKKVDAMIRQAYQEVGELLSDQQYLCLVKLMRGTLSAPVNVIARRVLVEGMSISQAKEGMQTIPGKASISAGVNRYKKAHQMVVAAYAENVEAQ